MTPPALRSSTPSGPDAAPVELVGSGAHVFVNDVEVPELTEPDLHHLARVLRLADGQPVTVSDGAGRWRRCRWTGTSRARAGSVGALRVDGPVGMVARPNPAVTVGFALLKGGRAEWVVQKLTEAGVDRIAPLVSARSVARWEPERAARHHERLVRVAWEAAMQSRRTWLPVVDQLAPAGELASALAQSGAGALAHPGGGAPSLDQPAILVGPEGGWQDSELVPGLALVGLGPTVLRSETAALAAGLILCALRSGLVAPVRRRAGGGAGTEGRATVGGR